MKCRLVVWLKRQEFCRFVSGDLAQTPKRFKGGTNAEGLMVWLKRQGLLVSLARKPKSVGGVNAKGLLVGLEGHLMDQTA